MTKVLSITITNTNGNNDKIRNNDLKELNEYLNDGWVIKTVDYIPSNITATFTAMYLIGK